jgi:ABC-2 type transport system permease protein
VSRVLHAEWTKMRTEPAARWLLPCIVVATVLVSLLAVAAASCKGGGCGFDPAALSLAGVQLGQAVVVMLAVLAMGGEQGTGLLRTTFTAAPRRIVVLAAKAVLIGGLTLAAGTVAVLGCVAAGRAILPGNGIAAPSPAWMTSRSVPGRASPSWPPGPPRPSFSAPSSSTTATPEPPSPRGPSPM